MESQQHVLATCATNLLTKLDVFEQVRFECAKCSAQKCSNKCVDATCSTVPLAQKCHVDYAVRDVKNAQIRCHMLKSATCSKVPRRLRSAMETFLPCKISSNTTKAQNKTIKNKTHEKQRIKINLWFFAANPTQTLGSHATRIE